MNDNNVEQVYKLVVDALRALAVATTGVILIKDDALYKKYYPPLMKLTEELAQVKRDIVAELPTPTT